MTKTTKTDLQYGLDGVKCALRRYRLLIGTAAVLILASFPATGQVLGSAKGQPIAGRQPVQLLAADSVTITAPEDGDYIDIDVFGPDIELLFDYTQQPGHTLIDIQLWVNGANTGFSCGWAGGDGSCYFTPSATVCGTVLQIKALFVGLGGGSRFSNIIGVWTYAGSSTTCLPDPPDQCGASVGGPINVVTGNMYYETVDTDIPSPLPLNLTRRYDSQSTRSGIFGPKWRHSFELEQTCAGDFGTYCNFSDPAVGTCFCGKTAQNTFYCLCSMAYNGTNTFTTPDRTKYLFVNILGVNKLDYVEDRNGNRITATYNPDGTLGSLTDTFGRALTFGYTGGLVTSVTRPDAVAITYGYTAGKLTSVNYPDGVTINYQYAGANMSSITDQYGHVIEAWDYDGLNRATLFHREDIDGPGGDPPVDQLNIAYDSPVPGQRQVTDALGNVSTYTVDPVQKVVTAISGSCESCGGDAESRSFLWTTHHRIQRITDGRGLVTEFTYDNSTPLKFRNILQVTEAKSTPLERSTLFCYHPTYNFVTVVKEESVGQCANIVDTTGCGAVTTDRKLTILTYSSTNGDLLSQEVRGCTGDSDGNVDQTFSYTTAYTYNSKGQLLSVDGPRSDVSDVTTYTYYPMSSPHKGFLETVNNALGHVDRYESYNSTGRALSILDPNLVRTTLTYDPMFRLASRTIEGQSPPDNIVTLYDYDDHVGRLETVTSPRGLFTTYIRDGAHRLKDIVDPAGNIDRTLYDVMSRVSQVERRDGPGPANWKHTFQYDSFHRLFKSFTTASTDPPQQVFAEFHYNENGNMAEIIDPHPDGHYLRYGYDELNRNDLVTRQRGSDPVVNVVTHTYDSQDNIATTTDAVGTITSQFWDDLGRLVRGESPDTGTTFREYDASGNEVRSVDASGAETLTTFDALNRPTTILRADPFYDVLYTYDSPSVSFGIGRRTGMMDPSASTIYHYDRRGLLSMEDRTTGSETGLTIYGYDKNANLTSLTYPLTDRIVNYAYDDADRVSSVSTAVNGVPQSVATDICYEPGGPLKSMQFGNGLTDTRTYDDSYQITSHVVSSAVLDYAYTYNVDLLIAAVTDRVAPANDRLFDYDDAHRLTIANGPWGNGSYSYDHNGNRLTESIGAAMTQYTYDAVKKNRLVSTSGANAASYIYDQRGMVTRKQAGAFNYGYSYDQRDRLALASRIFGGIGPAQTLGQYGYDGDDLRVIKQLPNQLDSPVTTYFYNSGGKLLEETTSSDAGFVGSNSYIWLDAQPIARIDNDGVTDRLYYYHTDYLGTPLRMTDSAATVAWSVELFPFGGVFTSPVTTTENNFRFPGQYFDSETELHQNWHRDYNPALGRYMTPDPIGFAWYSPYPSGDLNLSWWKSYNRWLGRTPTGEPENYLNSAEGVNLYSYVDNNPLKWTDPLGENPRDKWYGLPREFWDWHHGRKKPGEPDLSPEDARVEHEEWERLGKPPKDHKGKHRPHRFSPAEYCEANPAVCIGIAIGIGGAIIILFPPATPFVLCGA